MLTLLKLNSRMCKVVYAVPSSVVYWTLVAIDRHIYLAKKQTEIRERHTTVWQVWI